MRLSSSHLIEKMICIIGVKVMEIYGIRGYLSLIMMELVMAVILYGVTVVEEVMMIDVERWITW
jgi:hypothetical protein